MSAIRGTVFRNFADQMKELVKDGRREIAAQGHRATGRLIDTMEYRVTADDRLAVVSGEVWVQDYGIRLNDGVPASGIPASGAPVQRYIAGLIDWAKVVKPELNDKERRSFAFNVWRKHKEEGMPTRASFRFSRNGRRTGWIDAAYGGSEERILKGLGLEALVVAYIEEVVVNAGRP